MQRNPQFPTRQITGLCLLALASARGGRLITFEESIDLAAVRRATAESLLVLYSLRNYLRPPGRWS